MKRFTVPTNFNGVSHPFDVYIGAPCGHLDPLHFQTMWLKEMRGGDLPQDVRDSFAKLQKISAENEVSFEDLCVYALGASQQAAGEETGQPSSAEGIPVNEQPESIASAQQDASDQSGSREVD